MLEATCMQVTTCHPLYMNTHLHTHTGFRWSPVKGEGWSAFDGMLIRTLWRGPGLGDRHGQDRELTDGRSKLSTHTNTHCSLSFSIFFFSQYRFKLRWNSTTACRFLRSFTVSCFKDLSRILTGHFGDRLIDMQLSKPPEKKPRETQRDRWRKGGCWALLMLERNPSARYMKSHRFVLFNPPSNHRYNLLKHLSITHCKICFMMWGLCCTLFTAGLCGPKQQSTGRILCFYS